MYRHLESLKFWKEKEQNIENLKKNAKKPIQKYEKKLLSLPDNIIKTRVRSAILAVLLEKIEKQDLFIKEKEIRESYEVDQLVKNEQNAEKFYECCLNEIFEKKLFRKTNLMGHELFIINESIWKEFLKKLQEKMKGNFFNFLTKSYFFSKIYLKHVFSISFIRKRNVWSHFKRIINICKRFFF